MDTHTDKGIIDCISIPYPDGFFLKIRAKPSNVISTGHSHSFPVFTACGSLMDALSTKTSGYMMMSVIISTNKKLIRSKVLSDKLNLDIFSPPTIGYYYLLSVPSD